MSRHAAVGLAFATALAVGLALTGTSAIAADEPAAIECTPPRPCMMTDVQRVLRVLPRPQSNIYAEQSTDSRVVEANVAAFRPLIVHDRVDVSFRDPKNPTGWYKIGATGNVAKGWMQARDVIEWKQAMVVSYSHPGIGPRKRRPVLMFEDRKSAEDAVLNSADAPAIYDKLDKGEVPAGVISREPDRFIDIKKTFYVLPIIDFVPLKDSTDGVDARLLQVAAAVPNRRASAEEVCTTDRRDFRDCIRAAGGRGGESLLIDVVYVVDLTGSMQPFVDATADSIRESAQKFSEVAGAEERIKFGFVGYRDSTDRWPENEFVTKNFTPRLVDRRQFEALLRNAVAKEGGDVAEAVYAGVKEGLDSRWTDKSVKLLVLVGDASSHEPDDPIATSPYSATELRRFADDKGVNVAAIYIKNPRQQSDWAAGTDQFKTLATNPGGTVAFFPAESSPDSIKQTIFQGTALMIERLRELSTGGDTEAAGATLANPLAAALEGGLVVYLGSGAEPPRDITGWMSDRDLSNPGLRALDVNVLVTRTELDTLTSMLDALVSSYRAQEATGQSWFQNLRNMPLMAAVGQVQLKDALARSPIVPKWIAGLPYRSDILSLTFEEFESLGGSERQAMIERIDGMIRTYKLFMAGDGWVALQSGDPPSEHVFPLPLSTLP